MMSETKEVRVRFARPCQRQHHRLTAPLEVRIGDATYAVADWSATALRIGPIPLGEFNTEDRIELVLSIPFQDFNISLDVQARVVRIDESSGDAALQMVDLPPRAKELLQYFSENLIRGEMASIEGTIKRLDLPVTPPRPKANGEGAQSSNQTRRTVRSWLAASTYLLFGAGLAIGLLYTLYFNFFLVASAQALLYAPTAELIVPEEGVVSVVYVVEGERVAAGAQLLQVKSPRLEQLLFEARIREQEANITLRRWASLVDTERGATLTYQKIASEQVAAAEARLSSAQKQMALFERQHARLKQLAQQGFISTQGLDGIETDQQRAGDSVRAAQAELQIARSAVVAAQTGKYYTSNRLEGKLPELQDELVAARHQLGLAKTRVQELERQLDSLTLRAPIAGYVRQVAVLAGGAVRGGSHAVSLLSDQVPQVYAVVSADQLAQIALGDDANVYVPALARDLEAKVVAVKPRLWSLPENIRRLLGEPRDGGLVVLALTVSVPDTVALDQGLPVSVQMKNESTQHAVRWVVSLFGVTKAQAKPLLEPPASAALSGS